MFTVNNKQISHKDLNTVRDFFTDDQWDLIDKVTNTHINYQQDIIDQYPALEYYPILFISVLHNLRIREVLKVALEVSNERSKKQSIKNVK